MLGAMFMGLGAGAGALLGAWLYSSLGPEATFRATSVVALAGLVIFGASAHRARQTVLASS
jgi:predicted MFS family arabinose efflux permease